MSERPDKDSDPAKTPPRRGFLSLSSTAAMLAGLAGGYGAFALIAARFLYPAKPVEKRWLFVARADALKPGDSILYELPTGATVNITRQGSSGSVEDFMALSSVCPHLGCQVHWEAVNQRYFCPCHNGTFDPSGRGTGGPPGEAGLSLPRFPLRTEDGLLYIESPIERLADAGRRGRVMRAEGRTGPGHDPCLARSSRGAGRKDPMA